MPFRYCLSLVFAVVVGVVRVSGQETADTEPNTNVGDYILQPLDLLQVEIYQEPELKREVRVSQETAVVLPLIGKVDLTGLTVREAEQTITDRYNRDYLVNPQLNISVLEYARRTVRVLGAVSSAGEIQFPQEEGLNLLDAIARAGGFTRLADRKRIKLTRRLPDGSQETYIVNADELIEGGGSQAWSLRTNDLVYVPERLL